MSNTLKLIQAKAVFRWEWGTPQFHTPVSSTRHFPTRAIPFKSQNPSLQHVISTQLPQFHTYPSFNKSVSSTHFLQFHTNPSVSHKSVSSTQISHNHTSGQDKSVTSTEIRHFYASSQQNLSLLHKFISSTQTSLIWSFFLKLMCRSDDNLEQKIGFIVKQISISILFLPENRLQSIIKALMGLFCHFYGLFQAQSLSV